MTRGMAVLALAGFLFQACGGGGDQPAAQTSEEWGPLAVVEPSEGVMEARMTGTLRLTENCALLDTRGEDVLLVWPADRTTWNPDERTATLENVRNDETGTAGDGDRVAMGGGAPSLGEGWVDDIEWVSPPGPSCPTTAPWFVGEGLREWSSTGTPVPELGELSVEPSSGPVGTEVVLEGEGCWAREGADHTSLTFGSKPSWGAGTHGADDLPGIRTDDQGRFRATYVIPGELDSIQGEGGGTVEPAAYAFWSNPPKCSADFEVTVE